MRERAESVHFPGFTRQFCSGRAGHRPGSVTVNRVSPGALRTSMVPRCAFTTAATIANPRPVLPSRRERDESPRANRSKTSGCSQTGMPGPSSATVSTTDPSTATVSDVVTDVPGGVWVWALASRLREHLVQASLVADDHHRLLGKVQRPLMFGARNVGVADRIDDQARQIHRLALQRAPRVKPRQQQHVLDKVGHAARFRLHAAHRMSDIVGHIITFALRQFGVATDGGQRRAQLMAGVGDELADPRLAGMPRRQRRRDPVQHPVQRRAQLPHLGVRCRGVDLDDRCGQPHFAAVEFEVGHLTGGIGNPCQRGELAANDQDSRRCSADQRRRADAQKMTATVNSVSSTSEVGNPMTMVSPARCECSATAR